MTKAKTRNWLLTLAFSIMLLLGMTIAVHAEEYSTDNFNLGDAVRFQQGDIVRLVNIDHVVMYVPHTLGGGKLDWGEEQWGGNGPVSVDSDGNLRIHDAREGATVILSLPKGADCWTITKRNDGGSYICEISYLHIHEDGTAFSPWPYHNNPPDSSGNYFLPGDVKISEETGQWIITNGNTYDLCLNGHTASDTSSDIQLNNNGTLNLYDCGTNGMITSNGSGRGVEIIDGTFNMYGGVISGFDNSGIDILGGTFNMYGGAISNNSAEDGGGVRMTASGTFNMYDGTISNNRAANGGGICLRSGTINMSGGTISNNSAAYGGGIFNTFDSFNMSGGKIMGNSASEAGGGIFSFEDSPIYLTGSPQITGNTVDKKANNIHLENPPYGVAEILITGVLSTPKGTSGPQIGVTADSPKPYVFTSGLKNKLPSGKTASDFFFSDDPTYAVGETDDREAKLAMPLTITAIDQTYTYNGKTQGPGDAAYDVAAKIAEVVKVSGLKSGDELASLIVDGQGQKVGTYPLTPSNVVVKNNGNDVTFNYAITYVPGKLTITKPKPEPAPPQPKINKAAAKIALDAGMKAYSSGSKVTASWGAVKGASSYVIYTNYCDQKKCKKIKTVSGKTTSFDITKLNGKKFNPKKNLKFYVVAYKTVKGKKVKLAKSIMAHAPGSKNSKRTNVIGVKVKKASFTLKKGETAKIKAKLVLQKKGKKPLKHCAKFRYASSNKKVAKVSKKGKITAVGKGKCTVYVYAVSGVSKKIKVTVK